MQIVMFSLKLLGMLKRGIIRSKNGCLRSFRIFYFSFPPVLPGITNFFGPKILPLVNEITRFAVQAKDASDKLWLRGRIICKFWDLFR